MFFEYSQDLRLSAILLVVDFDHSRYKIHKQLGVTRLRYVSLDIISEFPEYGM